MNSEVIEKPGIINEDPYERGWVVKIKLDIPGQMEELMDGGTYEDFVKGNKDSE